MFHTKFLVFRLQNNFDALRKKRPQSVKLKSSQSDNDTPRNNSGKGWNQTDTLLDKMKITQKKGAEWFHTNFLVSLLQITFQSIAQKASAVREIKIKSIG